MATREDVRRIAISLPEVVAEPGELAFRVDGKLFAWPWMERIQPKKPRVANPDVIGVRVANELEKQSLLALDPDVFFTEPHYDGFPAILVRIPAIPLDLLETVLTEAWRIRAPRRLLA
jgi:hypothetical protein